MEEIIGIIQQYCQSVINTSLITCYTQDEVDSLISRQWMAKDILKIIGAKNLSNTPAPHLHEDDE